jgi:hypothetical protein
MRKPLVLASIGALLAGSGGLLYAQLDGADRGIPPVDSTSNFEVGGIAVDTSGSTAEEARQAGWKLAQRLGWKRLWARTTGRPENEAPDVGDAMLNQIVSGIVIEDEQAGPNRYIARLGLLFDRARTGQMIGVGGVVRRSAPMLIIPVMETGSTGYALEFRSPWQYAWAQFRTSTSPIDYVRPVGTGIDPLVLNAAQTGRRSRGWWRALLDQYGASDVVVPEVRLVRAYPGGPAMGYFTARYGPDGQVLGSFSLRADTPDQMQAMFAQAVQRMDEIYQQAFNAGLLRPNPSLNPPPRQPAPTPAPLRSVVEPEDTPNTTDEVLTDEAPPPAPTPTPPPAANTARPAPEGAPPAAGPR